MRKKIMYAREVASAARPISARQVDRLGNGSCQGRSIADASPAITTVEQINWQVADVTGGTSLKWRRPHNPEKP